MKQSPEQALASLQAGKPESVYFLHGDEEFFIDKISDFLEDKLVAPEARSFNLTVLYGKDADMASIISASRRPPMMAERQVVIIKEAQELSDWGKDAADKLLIRYLQQPLSTTILCFCYKHKKADGRKAIFKELEKQACTVESKKLYEDKVPDWLKSYIGIMGLKADDRAIYQMVENVGADLGRLANEVDKLLLNLPPGAAITEELVHKYVGKSKEYNVFELQKALALKQVQKAYTIVHYFEQNPKNSPAPVVLATLYNFFSKVLVLNHARCTDPGEAAKLLGVNFFFAKDYTSAASKYPLPKTEQIIRFLLVADLASKGVNAGSMSDAALYKELVYKILH